MNDATEVKAEEKTNTLAVHIPSALAVVKAAPKKDHRRVLVGACVEWFDGKTRMAATCGKILIQTIFTPYSPLEPVAVPVAKDVRLVIGATSWGLIKSHWGAIPKRERDMSPSGDWLRFENYQPEIVGGDDKPGRVGTVDAVFFNGARMMVELVPGKFPDCDCVIPSGDGFAFAHVNADHAERLAGALSDLAEPRNRAVGMRFHRMNAPITAHTSNEYGTTRGLIMPVKMAEDTEDDRTARIKGLVHLLEREALGRNETAGELVELYKSKS